MLDFHQHIKIIRSDFTEETCSIGALSMESSRVSDRVLNLCLDPININSVFVAFKYSVLQRNFGKNRALCFGVTTKMSIIFGRGQSTNYSG